MMVKLKGTHISTVMARPYFGVPLSIIRTEQTVGIIRKETLVALKFLDEVIQQKFTATACVAGPVV